MRQRLEIKRALVHLAALIADASRLKRRLGPGSRVVVASDSANAVTLQRRGIFCDDTVRIEWRRTTRTTSTTNRLSLSLWPMHSVKAS